MVSRRATSRRRKPFPFADQFAQRAKRENLKFEIKNPRFSSGIRADGGARCAFVITKAQRARKERGALFVPRARWEL
jgi:hypothetical protein